MMKIVNLTSYKFVTLHVDDLASLKELVGKKARSCQLKGTFFIKAGGDQFHPFKLRRWASRFWPRKDKINHELAALFIISREVPHHPIPF